MNPNAPSLALCFPVEEALVCTSCILKLAKQSGAPHLFLAIVSKPEVVNSQLNCTKCGHSLGCPNALADATQIEEYLKP